MLLKHRWTLVVLLLGFLMPAAASGGLTFNVTDLSVTEGGAAVTYTVRLQSQPSAAVTLTLTGQQVTVSPSSLIFTMDNWNTPQTVTVTAVNDNVVEDGHTGSISHAAASTDPNYNQLLITGPAVMVTDNDSGGVNPPPVNGTVTEGGEAIMFWHSLPRPASQAVTVNVYISPDSFVVSNPNSLLFTPDNPNVSHAVFLSAVDNEMVDGTRTATLILGTSSALAGYNGWTSSAMTITVHDNDLPGVIFSTPGLTMREGEASAAYTIRLERQPSEEVTIDLAADLPDQVTVTPSTLTFTKWNWDAPQTVTVNTVDDLVAESPLAVEIDYTLTSLTAYNNLAVPATVVNLEDDDNPGLYASPSVLNLVEGTPQTYTFVLNTPPAADVTVDLFAAGVVISPSGLVFTSADWNTPRQITLTVPDDSVAEVSAEGTLTHTSHSADPDYDGLTIASSLDITDNDTAGLWLSKEHTHIYEDGLNDEYAVALTSQPVHPVNVTISAAAPGQLTITPSQLTFTPADWNNPQTVTLSALDDLLDDDDVDVNLTYAANSQDSFYNSLSIGPSSYVTVHDNESPAITLSKTDGIMQEGDQFVYTVRLNSPPSDNVVVTIDLSAAPEMQADKNQLTFTPQNWHLPQTVTLSIPDDDVFDMTFHAEQVKHIAATTDSDYNGLSAEVSLQVSDDDMFGLVINSQPVTITEAGTGLYHTVRLQSKPTANVTLTPKGSINNQLVIAPAALTFTPANWDAPQLVSILALDDQAVEESPMALDFGYLLSSDDPYYNGLVMAQPITLLDNDAGSGGIVASKTGVEVWEGGTWDSYTVVLTSQPTQKVTVTLAYDASQVTATSSLVFQPWEWNTPKTVTVSAVDDTLDESAHNVAITHTITSTDPVYAALALPPVNVTINDNLLVTELLDNGGFEVGGYWALKFGSKDRRVCNTPSVSYARTGYCAYLFRGSARERAMLTQTLSDLTAFTPGQTINTGLYYRTNSRAPRLQVSLLVYYADQPLEKRAATIKVPSVMTYMPFNLASYPVRLDSTVTAVKVVLKNRARAGTILVDDLTLNYTTTVPR